MDSNASHSATANPNPPAPTNHSELNTIAENDLDRTQTDSPEPYVATTEVNDFGVGTINNAPQRRRTHPMRPGDHAANNQFGGPPDTPSRDLQNSVRRASTTDERASGARKAPRSFFARSKSSDYIHKFKNPERQATTITNASASFDDTLAWDRKTVLSLGRVLADPVKSLLTFPDGGGIRGYSALLIIQALMVAIGKYESEFPTGTDQADGPAISSFHPLSPAASTTTDAESVSSRVSLEGPKTDTSEWLPCHYFDYMAGTSTGGLISIMLGRLRMNIDDCISDYETLGGEVFGHPRMFHLRSPCFWIRDKYNHKTFEKVIRGVIRKRVPKAASFPGGRNFAFDENRCRTVVISYQTQTAEGIEKPYLFRTYKNLHKSADKHERLLDRNPALAHDVPIWQVARATAAAPTYFRPAKIDGLEYLDGGFGRTNNPCVEIYDEVRKKNNHYEKSVGFVLSIGTGKNKKISRFNRPEQRGLKGAIFKILKNGDLSRYLIYINFAKKWATDSESTHSDMIKNRQNAKYQFEYSRLNVEDGLDLMKLDEWKNRGRIRLKIGRLISRCRQSPAKEPDRPRAKSQVGEEKLPVSKELQKPRVPKWFQPKNKTLEAIRAHTYAYLKSPGVKDEIESCAFFLVKSRRERARTDLQRWEKACFGAWYQCNIGECPRGEKEYEGRVELRRHLLDKHRDMFTKDPKHHDALEMKD